MTNEKVSPATSLIARRYFRIEEVARYFAVSDRTVYRLIDMGDLQAVRLRGCTRVPVEEIRKLEERLRVVL